MNSSDQDDRKWRWLKALRRNLARALVRPETWKMIVSAGIWIARAVWVVHQIIHSMRE